MSSRPASRIWIISMAVLCVSFVLIARLYFVQIVEGDSYSNKADEQYVRPTDTIFDRGSVFFKTKDNKLVAAATIQSGYFLYINPKKVTDPEALYGALSEYLKPLDHDSFIAKVSKKNDSYEEIVHRLNDDTVAAIEKLNLEPVYFHKETWRYYPGDHVGAAVVGLMGFKGDVFAGRYGLESSYDDTLARDSSEIYTNFFAQIFNGVSSVFSDEKQQGDVVTTIDPSVESFLEAELKGIDTAWHPTEIGGIVIDPSTGEIVAMASFPTFDPNNPQAEKSSKVFSNPIVENAYEMGSIIKPLTMAAGIDAGVVTPETTYFDAGSLVLNGRTISNFDHKGRGTVSMQEVLNQSLNTGVTFVMLKLGRDLFSSYFKNYGLGEKTGITLPNESAGLIKNLDSPRDVEHATASFGQGIALTAINTARALSSLANGGYIVTPRIVKTINYRIGISKAPEVTAPRQVLKKTTIETVTRMLVTVYDHALLNGAVKMDHYSIAAKTGTAQIANPNGGGYYDDRYLHSFFGYFPAYNPKFLVFLYAKEPVGAQYASATLTHPFVNIAKFLINYYEIPPDR